MGRYPGLSYATGCLETCHIKNLRRFVTSNGGIFHELYAMPGYAIDATFRTERGARRACRQIWDWEVRQSNFGDHELSVMILEGYTPGSLFRWYEEPLTLFGRKDAVRTPVRLYVTRRPHGRGDVWTQVD